MSVDDINWVHALLISDERAKDVERAKHVLLYIASRSGNGKGCWASQETMAKEMGMPLRAVERAIRLLKKLGQIFVTRRAHKSSIITLNRKWVPLPDKNDPPTHGGSLVSPKPPLGGGSPTPPDPSSGGGSQVSAKPPASACQTATQAADKRNERAGRSRRAVPLRGEAWRSRRFGAEALDETSGTVELGGLASMSSDESPISDPSLDASAGASFSEIPVPSCSFENEGAGSASPGSPRRLDGGSPAPHSETARQLSSQLPLSQLDHSRQVAAPTPAIGRKPVLPPIENQELYNRLTKRSPR